MGEWVPELSCLIILTMFVSLAKQLKIAVYIE